MASPLALGALALARSAKPFCTALQTNFLGRRIYVVVQLLRRYLYSTALMESATLDDFMALNEQLAALAPAGVPVSLELQGTADTATKLERINAAIARRVSQGSTLEAALAHEDPLLSPCYRSLVQVALRNGCPPAALENSRRQAASVENTWQAMRSALVYPTIVCGFAYTGFILFCLVFVPQLSETFHSLRIPEGPGMHVLQSLSASLRYWIAVPPLAFVLLLVWQSARRHPLLSTGLVSGKTVAKQQRCASFAESLATLLESDMSFAEALPIASGAWNDLGMTAELQRQAAAVSQGRAPEGNSLPTKLPPFLAWALWQSEATTGRARALRMAASLYGLSIERRQRRLKASLPLVLCVIIGGGATLLYGLALFVPVIEMLRGLAS